MAPVENIMCTVAKPFHPPPNQTSAPLVNMIANKPPSTHLEVIVPVIAPAIENFLRLQSTSTIPRPEIRAERDTRAEGPRLLIETKDLNKGGSGQAADVGGTAPQVNATDDDGQDSDWPPKGKLDLVLCLSRQH